MPGDNDFHHHHHHLGDLSPHHHHLIDPNCDNPVISIAEHHHGIDLVVTLRSEIAALSYKKQRLATELVDAKAHLASKESECENLRAQAARQTALIGSLQSRLHSAENREQTVQSRCDSTIQTIQREKRNSDERNKELLVKIQNLEMHLANEESAKEQIKAQFHDVIRRLSAILGMDVFENTHLSESILTRAEEIVIELQRAKSKVTTTCETLSSCENELLNVRSLANIEKQRLSSQLDCTNNLNQELEVRCRQYERDLQVQRDRLSEIEINTEKLKDELKGFESRCHRLQNNSDRTISDRLQFLRSLANLLDLPESCETLIKDKIRDTVTENQSLHVQIHSLRDQLCSEHARLKETVESNQCHIRDEEAQKCELTESLNKCHEELHTLRKEHIGLSEYLQRLARALNWSECSSPPTLGTDTNLMAESLLERAERITLFVEDHATDYAPHSHNHGHHDHLPNGCDHHHHHSHFKLRRERSCHDIPLKESSSIYNLQRRVRILREQVQRRDLHLELLKRKLAIIENGARGKCALQGERDEAFCRAKKASKQVDKLTVQLADARSQIAEVKAQLAEAVEYKITALERGRKIDDLTTHVCELEEEKSRLLAQLSAFKERFKSSTESSQNRRCRDEALITSLREDVNRLQAQLADANHRLSHLQSFRTSVARTLHLRDLPETDLLHRLQTLCSAHQELTMLSKRYETASPVGEFCQSIDDPSPLASIHHSQPPPPRTPPKTHHHRAHAHHHHTTAEHYYQDQHRYNRNRSKSRTGADKRIHDQCFDSDVHRQHCKDELFMGSCEDDFDCKLKYG